MAGHLVLKGSFLKPQVEIKDEDERAVARVNRNYYCLSQSFANQRTFMVTIEPNVDLAIVSAMCICLDEKYQSR